MQTEQWALVRDFVVEVKHEIDNLTPGRQMLLGDAVLILDAKLNEWKNNHEQKKSNTERVAGRASCGWV